MKTKVIKEIQKFNPVTLEITFESQEEIDFLKELIGNLSVDEAEKIAEMNIPKNNLLRTLYNELNSI